MRDFIGRTLGHYRIVDKIGEGGMGEVYRAYDERLDRDVAIKVLPEEVAEKPDPLARFEREAKAVAKLNHPNILDVYELGDYEGRPFMATELLDGETLRERLSGTSLGWRKATEIGAAVADGLGAAHEAGICHRDLKPSNVFLTADGRVKVLDFGLARYEDAGAGKDVTHAPTITRHTDPGTVLGTVGYMSPEQVRGETVDQRSDIFSLGCVLYEMVSGQRAFTGDSAVETMNAILKEEPSDVSTSGVELPPELAGAIRRCLEKRPQARFQSASDLAYNLRTISSTSAPSLARHKGRLLGGRRAAPWIALAAVGVVLAVGMAVWWAREEPSRTIPATTESVPPSVAVLAFDDLSPDRETEYFGDGMADELINVLSKIPGLRVAARTSAFFFKGKNEDIRVIGERLNVANVLTGSVRRSGDRIRVTVQLNSAADGFSLWSEQYDRELVDIFAVQGEIAHSVADRLQVSLAGRTDGRVVRPLTENLEAYDLYLKGRFFWGERGEGLSKGLELFERAIELDPNFALAHAGVADTCGLMSWYGDRPSETMPRAKKAAERALELAPNLAETHSAIAFISWMSWDWERAKREFLRAIEIKPSYAPARNFFGQYLHSIEGKAEQAAHQLERAVELDPLNAHSLALLGRFLVDAGQPEDAHAVLLHARELDPTLPHPHSGLVRLFIWQSRTDEAVAAAEAEIVARGRDRFALEDMVAALAADGRPIEAEAVLDEIVNLSTRKYVNPTLLAVAYDSIGRRDDAFRWLDRAYRERSVGIALVMSRYRWSGEFFDDPRFHELRKRVGLEN